MTDRSEAARLRTEIAEARTKVKQLTGQIRHREGRLRRIAADAFNDESEPLTGMVVPVGNIVLGVHACEASPIGICAYDRLVRVEPLPGQRTPPSSGRIDGCLFCGTRCK